MKRPSQAGFTLVELLVTVTIIGCLITLAIPNFGLVREKANSMRCASNLRTIVTAVQNYAQDNDNRYPQIESMPSNPVYTNGEVGTLLGVLGPYGLTEANLRCPEDVGGPNYFAKEGSSYQWRPLVDDELVNSPSIYRRGRQITPPPSRLALAADYMAVHRGHMNCVFADGRVRTF